MFNKKWNIFLLLLLCQFIGLSQNPWANLNLIKSIEIPSQFISTDKLGNLYITSNQEILKYNANGDLLQKNSVKSFGNIHAIDASNPMKILSFFKDYNKIIFLDNMLSVSENTIDLSTLNLDQVTLAGSSHDNGMWVYNSINFEIVRMDPNLKTTHQSGNIAQLTGIAIKPIMLYEANNRVYLCDSVHGVFVFDVFGTYIKTIPIFSVKDFQVENNMLYFIDKNGFGSFNMDKIQMAQLELPEMDVQQIRLQKNRVYMKLKNSVKIYGY